jgi:molybdate transport system ATP-binding protein
MVSAQEARVSILKFENLRYSAGDFHLELNFEFLSCATGIFGPSGAGKTTILELVAGLRKPTAGSIHLNGQLLAHAQQGIFIPPECRQIGYVPQDLALFPHKTVEANLLFGQKTGAHFPDILGKLELAPLLQRYPADLSGGEKQRVAIGRALLAQPKLLMLDEPLSDLDDDLKQRGLELFRRVKDEFGTPLLYVSHNAGEIISLCDDVLIVRSGKVIGHGSPKEKFVPTTTPNFAFLG